ncbi:MAG: pilus assembly FimT family protein [Phycisphaeraceae bacterium]
MNHPLPRAAQPTGFTLIEVMAVVALIGLLAAATAWSLADDARSASRADVIDRLAYTDAQARTAARRFGSSTLRLDLNRQRIWIESPSLATGETETSHALAMPMGFRLDAVTWIDPTPMTRDSSRRRARVTEDKGDIALPISSEGITRTYAVRFTGPASDAQQAQTQAPRASTWLLFAGTTGLVTTHPDEDEIETIFDTLAKTRLDAD